MLSMLFCFQLENSTRCNYDYLEIGNQKICAAHSHRTIVTDVDNITVVPMTFKTDGSVTLRGFRIRFQFL